MFTKCLCGNNANCFCDGFGKCRPKSLIVISIFISALTIVFLFTVAYYFYTRIYKSRKRRNRKSYRRFSLTERKRNRSNKRIHTNDGYETIPLADM